MKIAREHVSATLGVYIDEFSVTTIIGTKNQVRKSNMQGHVCMIREPELEIEMGISIFVCVAYTVVKCLREIIPRPADGY